MNAKATNGPTSQSSHLAPDMSQFSALGTQAVTSWMENGTAALGHILDMNSELTAWSKEQWDQGVTATQSLASCTNATDAVDVQAKLVRTCVESSIRHTTNLLSLATNCLSAGLPGLRQIAAGSGTQRSAPRVA
jgi:hypothetical protein